MVHNLDEHLEEDVMREFPGLTSDAGGSLLMVYLQCLGEILKEER
jgi:hypothetical protein